MKVRFLLDENLSPDLKESLCRYDAQLDVMRIGDEGAPALGATDREILLFAESTERLLVTDNRRTMPVHASEHFAAGGHHWGIYCLRRDAPIGRILEYLILTWEASDATEWIDRIEWVPR